MEKSGHEGGYLGGETFQRRVGRGKGSRRRVLDFRG